MSTLVSELVEATKVRDRLTAGCPSWCTNSPGHEEPDGDGVVWHERVVLDLPLPEMRASDQLGRCGVGAVEVRITQYVDVAEPVQSVPGVMVTLTSTDFDHAVLPTASESEQVGQAMADAAGLLRRDAPTYVLSPAPGRTGGAACETAAATGARTASSSRSRPGR